MMRLLKRVLGAAVAANVCLAGCGDGAGPHKTSPDREIRNIVLDPPGGTFHTGDTVQLRATAVDAAGAAVLAAVQWSISDTAVATVGATGILVAKHSGTAIVTARAAAAERTATVSIVDAAVIEAFTDVAGSRVPADALVGRVRVHVNVQTLGRTAEAVSLAAACPGRADLTLAVTSPVATAATIEVPTDSVDVATGRPFVVNGACRWFARVDFVSGVARASPPVDVVVRNASAFLASYGVTGANAPFGTGFPSTIVDGEGREWRTGAVTLRLRVRNYDSVHPVVSAVGSFLGREFTATAPPSGGDLVVEFPNVPGAVNLLGIADYATPVEGSTPALVRATFADGSPAFVAMEAQALRIDNAAPAQARFVLPEPYAGIGWVNGAYTFAGTGRYDSGGDAAVGTAEVRFYGAAALGLTPLPGGTGTGTACTTAGLSRVTTGANLLAVLPPGVPMTSSAAVVRAFEADRLGNVRCTDLSTGPLGVDVVPPRLTLRAGSTPTRTLFNFKDGLYKRAIVNLAASDDESGIATPGQVIRRMLGVGYGFGWCAAGTPGSCAPTLRPDTLSVTANMWPDGALWRDSAFVYDRVGNVSPPLISEYIGRYGGPSTRWDGFPPVFVGGTTLRLHLTSTDGLGLMEVGLAVDYSYAPADMTINYPTYVTPERWVAFPTDWRKDFDGEATIPGFMRQLQIVDATDKPYDDSGEYTRAYALLSYAESVGGDRIGDFYGLGDKNMPLGYTYFGKGIRSFRLTTPPTSVSNTGGATVTLRAELATDVSVPAPFASACFYYSRLVNEYMYNPHYQWYPAGCGSATATLASATERRYVFDLTWNPPAWLGTAATPQIRAIGVNATGDGLSTRSSTSVRLVP